MLSPLLAGFAAEGSMARVLEARRREGKAREGKRGEGQHASRG